MRPIWKGDISFGLVSIPVQIVPVEEKQALHFHLLDSKDKSRIRYQRVNSNTGKEVPWDEIVKGYEFDKDNYIIVNEEAFEKASPEVFKSIDIEEFVDLAEIDPLYFEKPYYLIPGSKNQKAYVLLRESLKKTNKVGIAKVIIRTKEYLSLILPHNNALLLNLIHFAEDIRKEEDLNLPGDSLKAYKITEREIKMAVDLIKDMTDKWQPEKYHDDYREALTNWIEAQVAKVEKQGGKKSPTRKHDDVIDFVALLKKSMGKTKKKPSAKNKPAAKAD